MQRGREARRKRREKAEPQPHNFLTLCMSLIFVACLPNSQRSTPNLSAQFLTLENDRRAWATYRQREIQLRARPTPPAPRTPISQTAKPTRPPSLPVRPWNWSRITRPFSASITTTNCTVQPLVTWKIVKYPMPVVTKSWTGLIKTLLFINLLSLTNFNWPLTHVQRTRFNQVF